MEHMVHRRHKIYSALILLGVFVLLIVLNCFTVNNSDDYYYMSVISEEGVWSKIKASIDYAFGEHYQEWSGRAVAHSLAVFFLSMPKWIFNIANSFIGCILILLIAEMAKISRSKNMEPAMMLLIACALWLFIPAFGNSLLWETGACNYLWCTTVIFFFVFQYEKVADGKYSRKEWVWILPMFLLGILAGWCNENTSGAALIAAIGCMIIAFHRKCKMPMWAYSGVIGLLFGLYKMISAPGNAKRISVAENQLGKTYMANLLKQILSAVKRVGDFLPIIAVTVIIFIVAIQFVKNREQLFLPGLYILCGISAHGAMIFSPNFPERAAFGATCFYIVADIYMLSMLEYSNKKIKVIAAVAILSLSIGVGIQYGTCGVELYATQELYKEREKIAASWSLENPMKVKYIRALSPVSVLYPEEGGACNTYLEDKYNIEIQEDGDAYIVWSDVVKIALNSAK